MRASVKTEGDKYIISIEVERDTLDWTLDPHDALKVENVGGVLTVRPETESLDAKFQAVKADIFARYDKSFRDLAQ